MSEATSQLLKDDDKVSPSYSRRNRRYHIHRTGAWQDPTGSSRYSLCGIQIGPVGREVKVSAVLASRYWNRFCKTCLKLKDNGSK